MILDNNSLQNILDRTSSEVELAKEISKLRRLSTKIPKGMFNLLMEKNIDKLSYSSGSKTGFIADGNASYLFNYLFKYLTEDENFEGDLDKGILLVGNYGVGKTLIMTAFCNMVTSLGNKRISVIHSKKLIIDIGRNERSFQNYSKGILCIDDLGKEPTTINNFGTVTNPMEDLITARYENNALTFATGNLSMESYERNYGGSISDRMKAMFNVISITGKSKR
jgi:DNA replication protein DnaC